MSRLKFTNIRLKQNLRKLEASSCTIIGCIVHEYFQTRGGYFNKGSLFNAGFLEIERRFPSYFNCMVLQDVDVLPETDRISYACRETAWHLAAYVDTFRYKSVSSFDEPQTSLLQAKTHRNSRKVFVPQFAKRYYLLYRDHFRN